MSNIKRRRLTTTPQKAPVSSESRKLHIPNPACTSCRRSLAVAYFILCSRCSGPTCVVCSRTCDASVPSDPPPSNLSSPMPVPRRVALAANSANTNPQNIVNNIKCSVIGKRRKFTDDSANAVGHDIDDGCLKAQNNNVGCNAARQLHYNHLSSGCGRVVCRNCCSENSQSAITCHDCRNGS